MATDLTDLPTSDDWEALLTDTERRLVLRAARGESLDLRTGDSDADAVDNFFMWDDARVIRSPVLEVLLAGGRDDWLLHRRGLRLTGARIDGPVDLDHATIDAPMTFAGCVFTEPVELNGATIRQLEMPGCWLEALVAENVEVASGVRLHDGFWATGGVWLHGAKIGGTLDCHGGSLANSEGHALDADRADVTGSVDLGRGFTATGKVRLVGAKIGGDLSCSGGSFTHANGDALVADGADVTGGVELRRGFIATGTSLVGAKIGASLDCDGGSWFANSDGEALSADRVDVGASVYLVGGFTAFGKVRLVGATIGHLEFAGGVFANSDDGGASGEPADGLVDLRAASVGVLVDNVERWPDGWTGDGFMYGDFVGRASVDVGKRLVWLGQQAGGFRPGPYSHLAAVYRRRGNPEAARRVLIERERRRTTELTGWRRRLHRAWGIVSAYGYQPSRAVAALLGLIVLGGVAFAFAPMDSVVDAPLPFLSGFYAADLAIPLVDFGLAADWQPTAGWAVGWTWATIALGWFLSLAFVAAVTGIFKPDE